MPGLRGGAGVGNDSVAGSNTIDFRRSAWPGIIKNATGLSSAEQWGTWSLGGAVTLEFSTPLPERFAVHLVAHAFGPNVGKEFVARVGDSTIGFTLGTSPEKRVLEFSNPGRSKSIEIHIPSPASLKSLGQGGDERKSRHCICGVADYTVVSWVSEGRKRTSRNRGEHNG